MENRLTKALALIDQANGEDPRKASFDGSDHPYEWVYSRHMDRWLRRLEVNPSEVMVLSCYGQHIKRWQLPRDTYPLGKAGYYQWRTRLKTFHGEELGKIMASCGYGEEDISLAQLVLSKNRLGKGHDPSQTLEDVICLVFLEVYLEGFAQQHPEEKLRSIIAKTWKKMSSRAQDEALTIPFKPHIKEVVLAGISSTPDR